MPRKQKKIQEIRADRYRIQSIARHILIGEGLKQKFVFAENYHRTAKCTHTRISHTVGINRTKQTKKAFYSGLSVCGDVWNCPVCASKIQEKRRQEIATAFDWAYQYQRKAIMVTFTFPHSKRDKLSKLLMGQAEAFKKLRSGNAWTKLKNSIGFGGLIRSLEITHGLNGWHPHTHEAWFVLKDTDTEFLRDKIALRWFEKCLASGLIDSRFTQKEKRAFLRASVHIMDNCSTSEYLAKQDDSKNWGIDRELASSSTKFGKSKGKHIFGILAGIEESDNKKQLTAIYLEYVKAIKGKRQIYWSPKLKYKVGINDISDQEIAETEESEYADLLAELLPEDWKIIIKNNAKSIILDLAENKGKRGIINWFKLH